MATKLGIKCKIYHGTAGTQAATLLKFAQDATTTIEREEHDATVKDIDDLELIVAGIKKFSFDFKLVYDPADTSFIALQTAFLANTPVAFLILDGLKATAGTQGPDGDFYITKFQRNEEVKGLMTYDVSIKPALTSRTVVWATMA